MKYFIYFINTCLLVLIPVCVFTTEPTINSSNASLDLKKLESKYVMKTDLEEEKVEEVKEDESKEETKQEEVKNKITSLPKANINNKHGGVDLDKLDVAPPRVVESPKENSLGVYVGTMSAYIPYCYGCTGNGYTAQGYYVGDGNIYYNDKEYGRVRIVAGDNNVFKFGTILRVETPKLPVQNVIMLDTGGQIGFNHKCLFDLLFDTKEAALNFGLAENTRFTVLREGF